MDTSTDIRNHVQDLYLEGVICSYLLQPPGMQDGTPSCNADSLMVMMMMMMMMMMMIIPDSAAYVGKDTIYIMDISELWA